MKKCAILRQIKRVLFLSSHLTAVETAVKTAVETAVVMAVSMATAVATAVYMTVQTLWNKIEQEYPPSQTTRLSCQK